MTTGRPQLGIDYLAEIPADWMDEFHCALGRFVNAFARTEMDLIANISNFANEGTELRTMSIIKALLGGPSFNQSKDILRRLLRVTDLSTPNATEAKK